jgi:hypothetical protein
VDYTVRVLRRSRSSALGPTWSASSDITASLSPTLTAPPTTSTEYEDADVFPAVVFGDRQEFEYTFQILNDTDDVVHTATRLVEYYTGEQLDLQ